MRKSLKSLFTKLRENNSKEGYAVLKNIRGGILPPDGNTHCENANICGSTNNDCTNSGNCTNTTNNGAKGCTNHLCYA